MNRNTLDSVKISLVVGTILSLINQYDVIFSGDFAERDVFRILLNYLVPFCVATISRAMYIKKEKKS